MKGAGARSGLPRGRLCGPHRPDPVLSRVVRPCSVLLGKRDHPCGSQVGFEFVIRNRSSPGGTDYEPYRTLSREGVEGTPNQGHCPLFANIERP
jgi:hypothetical protein